MQDSDHEQTGPGRDQLPAHTTHSHAGGLVAARSGAGALSLDVRDTESGQGDEEIDLLSYWRVLLKRKWTVFTTLGIVFFTALVATLLTTPIYRATATLQIDLEPTKVVEVGATTAVDSMATTDYYQTQYELLKSRTLARKAGQQLVSEGVSSPTSGHVSPLTRLVRLLRRSHPASDAPATHSVSSNAAEEMAGIVGGGLGIEPVRESRLVRVNFDSPSAEFATQAANAVAESFIASNIERGFGASAYARKYLEDHLQQLRVKLEDSERQLVQVAQQEKIFSSKDGQSLSDQNLAQLNTALAVAQDARIRAEARWRQAETASGTALPPDMLLNSIIHTLQERRAELMGQYQDKLSIYKPAYPAMQQLQSQIAEIDQQIKSEVANIKGSARSEYQAALSQETLLTKQMDAAKNSVLDLEGRSIRYNVLKREVDTNRQLYDSLLQRYKEVGLAGGVTSNNISMVDRAEVPGAPYKPDLGRNLLLATLLGLALGTMLAFFFDYLDDTLKTPDEIEKQLGLAVLGIIPKLKNITPSSALEDVRSPFSEAYRSVRTALQFSTESGVPRSLLITSSIPSEGKSTTALTLAQHFAQLGKRVLLIDADLRNPTLHKTLGIDNNLGLSNCLAGAAKPQDVIHTPAEANLHVIPSGPLPPNPAELLAGPKLLALLTVAMAKYDQVIIDGPPTMGLADAPIIAHVAMGTLLVIDAGQTRKQVARAAVKRLLGARAHLVGALLTKVDTRAAGYGGYGYSDYAYYTYGGRTPKLTKQ
jgi:capsular exopolysaccharide synthesis family protein